MDNKTKNTAQANDKPAIPLVPYHLLFLSLIRVEFLRESRYIRIEQYEFNNVQG